MVMLKNQWAQPARNYKYPHSEQQQMPREQKPAINWSFKKFFIICASKTRKGLKWFQSTVTDQKTAKKAVQTECSHQSLPEPGSFLPSREHKGARGQPGICAVKALSKAAPFLKVRLGVHFWQNGCPGRTAEEQARKKRSAFHQDLVSYVFNSAPSARLHKHTGVESFKLHIILCCSFTTAQPATKKRT